jgi:hypothetical protein
LGHTSCWLPAGQSSAPSFSHTEASHRISRILLNSGHRHRHRAELAAGPAGIDWTGIAPTDAASHRHSTEPAAVRCAPLCPAQHRGTQRTAAAQRTVAHRRHRAAQRHRAAPWHRWASGDTDQTGQHRTDWHRAAPSRTDQHRPAPTGTAPSHTDRHRPAPTSTDRHRAAQSSTAHSAQRTQQQQQEHEQHRR